MQQRKNSGPFSAAFSTLSMRDSVFGSSGSSTAVYKGMTVSVYDVEKSEISLTGGDLVELIHVCSPVLFYVLLFTPSTVINMHCRPVTRGVIGSSVDVPKFKKIELHSKFETVQFRVWFFKFS